MLDIQQLAEQIEKDKQMVKAKELFLKQLQAQNKPQSFSETKFGKAYFRTIQKLTLPFANLHQSAGDMIDCPEQIQAKNLIKTANIILAKALKFEDNSVKDAEKMAIKCATHVIKMETFIAKYPEQHPATFTKLIADLDSQVQRLRPTVETKQLEDLDNLILSHIQGVYNAF